MSDEFGKVVDYFGVAGAGLSCTFSDSGAERSVLRCSHYGPVDAYETGQPVYNPKCVYEVVGDVDFVAMLGQMCVGVSAMLTGVRCETRLGAVPRITLTGTANEGAAAINLFQVSFPVGPRHRAQNLMGALSGAGDALQACSLSATCQPIVLWEGMAPSASDVVDGVVTVEAETLGTGGAAASGWSVAAESVSGSGTGYRFARRSFWRPLPLHSGT